MADEHKLQTQATRGVRAQSLLENELLKEAFKLLEEQYTTAWLASAPRDADGRERIFSHIQNLRQVQEHLRTVIANGKLAQNELNKLAETAERKKRFGIL